MSNKNETVFGLVHGSWQGAWCWSLLQSELQEHGYRSVAMDLPIEDPQANFNNYADTVVDALKDETDIVLVGHSRAGNVLPRVAGRLSISKLVFLGSSFEAATTACLSSGSESPPRRNSSQFQESIVDLGNSLTRFSQPAAKELFFHDCSAEIQEWASQQFRPSRRSEDDPSLAAWPNLPQEYIVCSNDRVVNPEWSRFVARNWLGVEPIEFASGHSAFLSKPKELAGVLIALAAAPVQRQTAESLWTYLT